MSDETFRIIVSIGILVTTCCAIVAAVVLLGVASQFKKLQVRVQTLIDRAEPILDSARKITADATPKLASITADAVEVVRLAKAQTEKLSELVKDFADRAKIQVARIDGTIDHTLENVQTASTAVKGAVLRPVREFNGFISGIRTAVSVYATGRRQSVDHATQDEELFI